MPPALAPTVEQVVTAARGKHPLFRAQSTGDPLVWQFLTEYQQELLARIADIKRDAVQELESVVLPLDDFAAGALILQDDEDASLPAPENPGYILIHGGDVIFESAQRANEPLDLVEFSNRHQNTNRFRWPAYVQGYTLYLLGDEAYWRDVARIDLWYFPAGQTLRGPGQRFLLPHHPLQALVAAAAHFLATRADAEVNPKEGRPVNVTGFLAEKLAAEEKYLDRATGRRRAHLSTVREVW